MLLFWLLLAVPLLAQERIDGLLLHFERTPAQQQALEELLDNQARRNSPDYQRWLSPTEFAARFGPAAATQTRTRTWLRDHGLTLNYESQSGAFWIISGERTQLENALAVRLERQPAGARRRYLHRGSYRLPDGVAAITGLDDPLPRPQATTPAANAPDGSHFLAPDDYFTIYNIPAGLDAPNIRIAVVGQSRIDLEDMRTFRRRFGLPDNDPEVILVPGSTDPGFVTDDQIEANLDLQWAGAIARNARLRYVYAANALVATAYVIDQRLAPIVSVSFTAGCEPELSPTTLNAFRSLAQQAAALGISWINAAGDAGAAGCDGNRAFIAQNGFAVEMPNGVPEVTTIGGTELNDREGDYWAPTNSPTGASALGYIPEIVWNQSRRGTSIAAGGSGVSIFFPRPPWQPAGSQFRTVPDLSLAASTYNGYRVIHRGRELIVGGTSAGAPAFAGMVALLLEANGRPQGYGNLNRLLYPLAQATPEAFRDITVGDNRVPCVFGTPDCGEGAFGYTAGPGFDRATGLGSPNFARFLAGFPRANPTQSLITITSDRNPVYVTPSPSGNTWTTTFTFHEHNGVATTLTSFRVDDVEQINNIQVALGSLTVPANGLLNLRLSFGGIATPLTRTYRISGRDESGQTWQREIFVAYLGTPAAPRILGLANGASFTQSFAPGAILSVFGENLAQGTQAAQALPLTRFSRGVRATINGLNAPLYYVSPTQVNLQIPYGLPPGPASLTLAFPQQGASGTTFTLTATAPGIFTDSNRFAVPQTSCARGQTCILFLTGQGEVSPVIPAGEAPALSARLEELPRPLAPVTMTIGGVPAQIVFAGIPPALVGVTQVNFTVAPNTPTGPQDVIIRIGGADSAPARITVQ